MAGGWPISCHSTRWRSTTTRSFELVSNIGDAHARAAASPFAASSGSVCPLAYEEGGEVSGAGCEAKGKGGGSALGQRRHRGITVTEVPIDYTDAADYEAY
ncbi:hypothetical protein GQ55_5G310900 [Panicum hallii var. hallii]|uniref:Uncharacterized protein n=1 Tax=Panicum hallii var. hallii TaxID=1504633 RepID=A0A2T7DLM6_9POAL|nr:hypothetical protein GQ55_5G310900 [Panicum hallii var. hallii]